MQKVL